MTTATNPTEILYKAAEIIGERGQTHGDYENNFQLIADLFTLRIGRDFHPYEVCILLECVKDARMFSNPENADNYLDGINYRAFASLFAKDYLESGAATNANAAYKRKSELKKAELKSIPGKPQKHQPQIQPKIVEQAPYDNLANLVDTARY